MNPTLGTLRDLDIMQPEGEAYALEIYDQFMGELYGKRQRPDRSITNAINSMPQMPASSDSIPESFGQPPAAYAG